MATERATANPGQSAATRTIPFGDLARERAELGAELTAAVDGVLTRGWFVLGPEVEAFEREFAAYCGCAHAIGVASGTDAVMLALVAAGVQPGDEVITTAHTAIATAMAIALTGATPVLADVDPTHGLIDPTSAAALITDRTTAIVPVHLYGQPVNVSAFERITRDTGIPFVEDCAQ
ncbi:MAG: DegT/DnrJ/EryC1/StrS family aminotransferase, partial [Chloroflexi bacterium]|nr:DegT/DnrJ/EryC1/StrS family aminotransferase [Chloroflexota bacterium]